MMLFISLVSLSIWQFTFAQEENSTTLEVWTKFREDLWELAWGFGNIAKIIKSTEPLDCSDGCKVISAEWEVKVVRAKYNESNKTIYYYTEAEKIYFNPQSAEMFSQFTWLTQLDMTGFDTSKVTDMSNMFKWCSKIKKLDLKKWDTSNVTDMSSMFHGCSALNTLDISKFNTSNVTDMSNIFRGCSALKTLNLKKWDTSNVTDMSNMFNGCSGLTWLDVSKFDTSNVENMEKMFNNCSNIVTLDVSKFNTSNVTNMSSMFNWCSKLTGLDLSKFDTSKVTSMEKMFNNCKWLKNLNLNNFNTNNVTTMQSMFNWCSNIIELDLSNFVTNKLININSMFNNCWSLKELNLSWWNTNNVTDMNQLFNGCSNLEELDLTTFNTSNVTRMNWMFWWDSLLTTIYASELFSLSDITTSSNMFKDATNIIWWSGTTYNEENVDWTYAVIDQWEGHPWYFSIKNKESIFLPWEKFNAKIKSLANLTGMTFNNVDSEIISITRSYKKPQIDNLEILSIIWAKNPIYARYDSGTIFYYTESKKIYMNPNSKSMFQWLSKLESLDLRDVYTNNVTDMRNMFQNCASLKTLDISNFDTSNVTNMEGMFEWCESIQELNLENFNTSRVTNMSSMFQNCTSLERLNVSSFDTSSVWPMKKTFSFCTSLKTLDISNFDTSNVTNMNSIFYNMSNLETIYASESFVTTALSGWKNDTAKPAKNMFSWDIKLVWWNGTVYDSSMVESGYARIDNQTQSWYFTNILDKKYYITYNLDGWVISWEKTTYTQRDSFILPTPTKEWYDFIWWTWSNLENLEIEVVIPEKTRWDLEYTANWRKVEQKSDDKYSWWGSRTSQAPESIEENETKADENEYNNWKAQGTSIENYDSDYSLEENEAYQFAYNNWITTMPSVVKANMYDSLNRIAMAKMLSNYAINVLWKKPSNIAVPEFSDVTQELEADYWWAVSLSYQLWIMWINISEFRPFDVVTRWEFATALSRMLFWITDGDVLYYEPHIKKLFEEKIISITNPNLKELRWYVMIMLMRSAKNK